MKWQLCSSTWRRGWKAKILTFPAREPIANRKWKGDLEGGNGSQARHGRRRKQRPIHALVGAGIAKVQEEEVARTRT